MYSLPKNVKDALTLFKKSDPKALGEKAYAKVVFDGVIKPIWQFYFDNFNGPEMDAPLEGIAHDELEEHLGATWDAALSCFMAFSSGYDTKGNEVLAETLIQGEIFCSFHYRLIEARYGETDDAMAAYVAIAPLRANIALCAGEFLGDPDAVMAARQIFEAIKDPEGVKVCDEVLSGLQQ